MLIFVLLCIAILMTGALRSHLTRRTRDELTLPFHEDTRAQPGGMDDRRMGFIRDPRFKVHLR